MSAVETRSDQDDLHGMTQLISNLSLNKNKLGDGVNVVEELEKLQLCEVPEGKDRSKPLRKDPETDSGNEDCSSDSKEERDSSSEEETDEDESLTKAPQDKDVLERDEQNALEKDEQDVLENNEQEQNTLHNKESTDVDRKVAEKAKESSTVVLDASDEAETESTLTESKKGFKDLIINGETGEAQEDDLSESKGEEKPKGDHYLKRGTEYPGIFDPHETLSTPGPADGYNLMPHMEDNPNAMNFVNDLMYNDNLGDYQHPDYSLDSWLMSPDSSPLPSYGNPASHGSSCYDSQSNNSCWYESPEASPSPLDPIDQYQYECTNISADSDIDFNARYNYSNPLTPPRSVPPPEMYPDLTSASDQSCMKIVDLIDPFDQKDQVAAADDELKNLLNALGYGQDSSLHGLKAYLNSSNSQKANNVNGGISSPEVFSYEPSVIDPMKKYWQDVQETDSNELNVYLPSNQLLDPDVIEQEMRAVCDEAALFELESRVSELLSNNPLALIPDDQHRDTNLTVLASRDENNRDNIHEKIYALSRGLSNVHVCCGAHVQRSRCSFCGNASKSKFHTPLTLRNLQGYTALSCAVLSGYPEIIVKYLVMLLQKNSQDLIREFSGMRNTIYLDANDYPFLSRFATEYESPSWQ